MDNLFVIFIIVIILAFAIIPILAVRSFGKSDEEKEDAVRNSSSRRPRRKKAKDSVSAKVSPVRKASAPCGENTADYLGIIEFQTESGFDKSCVVDEDIDSFLVTGSLLGGHSGGFDYSNRKGTVYHDCRMIKKTAVTAYYKDLSETKYFYKDQPVQYVEREGKTYIEVYDGSVAFLKEFSVSEPAGGGYRKYYKAINPSDPNLRKETESYHENLSINFYGVTQGMSSKEYDDAISDYLIDKLTKTGMKKDNLRRLLLGIYGYRYPDDGLFTDIEKVFEKIIPRRYRQLEENSISRSNFRGELISAIMTGYRTVGCKYGYTLVDDDMAITPSPEYSYYICLVLHLMLLKNHKAGKRPYVELDLSNVWKWLQEGLNRDNPLENHNPVFHGNVLLCEDLSEFTIEAFRKLVYFKQFDKSENNE